MTDWPAGVALARLEEVDSTNEEARRRAEAGEAGPIWIAAARQTAGRGRQGRVWQSLPGNLAATLLLRPEAPPMLMAQLSFAASLAVAEMVSHVAPEVSVTVKWPNDVLVLGRKLAGILLEVGKGWLAIGIGINLTHFPPDTEFPAISLTALGVAPPSPSDALTLLAARFAAWHRVWRDEGFEPLRAAWLARAGALGVSVRARTVREERHGSFEGIDANGALLLKAGGHIHAITAGEVFFG